MLYSVYSGYCSLALTILQGKLCPRVKWKLAGWGSGVCEVESGLLEASWQMEDV